MKGARMSKGGINLWTMEEKCSRERNPLNNSTNWSPLGTIALLVNNQAEVQRRIPVGGFDFPLNLSGVMRRSAAVTITLRFH
ncbi:hypothetical protein Bpfe_001982 [Biomphalaria pfeifferi]|uniref:Uncharacterized protein n=1 Tax=Biomphalaria pfeifferi TaxID=112525 RepID=A0AAD8C8W6_BIOPF|nr:hypothetical protein Bpfe_001982 [Biomphalaria pfeifferi]